MTAQYLQINTDMEITLNKQNNHGFLCPNHTGPLQRNNSIQELQLGQYLLAFLICLGTHPPSPKLTISSLKLRMPFHVLKGLCQSAEYHWPCSMQQKLGFVSICVVMSGSSLTSSKEVSLPKRKVVAWPNETSGSRGPPQGRPSGSWKRQVLNSEAGRHWSFKEAPFTSPQMTQLSLRGLILTGKRKQQKPLSAEGSQAMLRSRSSPGPGREAPAAALCASLPLPPNLRKVPSRITTAHLFAHYFL